MILDAAAETLRRALMKNESKRSRLVLPAHSIKRNTDD
jgi:hypothetical protein